MTLALGFLEAEEGAGGSQVGHIITLSLSYVWTKPTFSQTVRMVARSVGPVASFSSS